MKDRTTGYRIFTVCNCLFLGALALACLYPFYYVVVASISDPNELVKHQGLLFAPLKEMTLAGYRMVFQNKLVLSGYRNTLIILAVGLVFNLVLTTMGAYVLSLKDLLLRKPLTILVIVTMYFSGGLVPTYLNIRDLGLMDSMWSLIIPGAITTSNLIIMRSAFMAVPDSLPEAAKMDGASHLQVLLYVMLPLVKATMAVMVLYYGVAHWNAWFNASIYLRSSSKYPLQLVLRNILMQSQTTDMMSDIGAAESPQVLQLIKYSLIVVSSVPIMAIYPFLQRFFQKGVTMGAVKG
ncbi:MAG: carbohydrate ABC transporter permease [Hungatella sp.]